MVLVTVKIEAIPAGQFGHRAVEVVRAYALNAQARAEAAAQVAAHAREQAQVCLASFRPCKSKTQHCW